MGIELLKNFHESLLKNSIHRKFHEVFVINISCFS